MIYEMVKVALPRVFGEWKIIDSFPEECKILDIIEIPPLWSDISDVPYIEARRFKVFKVYYSYDKNKPPFFIKGGE